MSDGSKLGWQGDVERRGEVKGGGQGGVEEGGVAKAGWVGRDKVGAGLSTRRSEVVGIGILVSKKLGGCRQQ